MNLKHIEEYETNNTSIDRSHCVLISGTVLSLKPKLILELGVGSGFLSQAILNAIKYNNCGKLISVDNWQDFNGIAQYESKDSWTIVNNNEHDYIKSQKENTYDMIISDADHSNSHNWLKSIINISTNNSILFFHDTNNKNFPNLMKIESEIKKMKLASFHFMKNSLNTERCDRGLLMVINKKFKNHI